MIGEVLGMTPEEASKDTNAFGPEREGGRAGGREGREGGGERV